MRGRRAELKAIEGGLSTVPPPPAHLPPEMRTEWNICAADLLARQLLADSMLGVLASYVTAVWTVAECRKALAADGFFVKTKAGEPKPHPAAGMLAKHQELVTRLGAELGLTPAARSRKALQPTGGRGDDDDAAALGI